MINPSGFVPVGEFTIETEEVTEGMFVGTNSYRGNYNYFSNRPMAISQTSVPDDATREIIRAETPHLLEP